MNKEWLEAREAGTLVSAGSLQVGESVLTAYNEICTYEGPHEKSEGLFVFRDSAGLAKVFGACAEVLRQP
jgi:hypothetical protein